MSRFGGKGHVSCKRLIEMPSMFFLKDTVKTIFPLLNMCSYSNDALKERIIIDGIDFVFVENCLQFAWMF